VLGRPATDPHGPKVVRTSTAPTAPKSSHAQLFPKLSVQPHS
jgi:hypothetical protein